VASEDESHLLVAPPALEEAFVEQCGESIAARQRGLYDALPLLIGFDRDVSNERLDAPSAQDPR